MRKRQDIARSFPPIAGDDARLLILGSMPGAASLEAGEYYAHPRNAFWAIMGRVFSAGPGLAYAERCERLQSQGVAVWDVLRQCRREGSLDASIEVESEQPNDFGTFLARYNRVQRIFFNGAKAEQAFRRHVLRGLPELISSRLTFQRLPSTSPAHAGRSFEEKLSLWRAALGMTDSNNS